MATQKKDGGKIPMKLRLRAWWEGYDTDEIAERLASQSGDEGEGGDSVQSKIQKAEATTREVESAPTEEEELDPWNAEKVNIAQYIWGEGFCGPGGPDYIVALSKLMALRPEMSMLDLGAGLGGPARVLADRFGVWITGYEESPMLVERGNEMSKMQGMEKKAEIEQYNPADVESFSRKFDRAFAKESLFTIENKAKIIGAIEQKLKPGGLVLITDYVLGNKKAPGKDSFMQWKVGERTTPYPVEHTQYEEIMKKVNLQVRVSEDISETYIKMINKAWGGADEIAAKLAREEDGTKMIQMLMKEAEFWTRRKKMLESGDLRLWRLVGNKKSSGPSMMSDW